MATLDIDLICTDPLFSCFARLPKLPNMSASHLGAEPMNNL